MTSKLDFTADEWKVLSDAPLVVGGAVAAAAQGGLVETIKEGMALVKSMMTAAQRHPNNHLIQEAVPKGMSREHVDLWTNIVHTMMQQSETARMKTAGIETCQKVAMILQNKADPQEADEFKRWLLEIGEGVASAANEGRNIGGNISPEEAELLSMMSSALGVTHIPGSSIPESYRQP